MTKKILFCDDHAVLLDALVNIFPKDKYTVVGKCTDPNEINKYMEVMEPHVLIVDLNLPGKDGLTIISEIRPKYPDLLILVLTSYNEKELVKKAEEVGANGYQLKSSSSEELLEALKNLALGSFIAPADFTLNASLNQYGDDFSIKYKITGRELEILKLIAKGLKSKEIGDKLFISYYTVDTHRKNLMKKLGVNSSTELVKFAYEKNLV